MKNIYLMAPLVATEDAGITVESIEKGLEKIITDHKNVVNIIPTFLENGPSSIENEVDDALCIPELMRQAMGAVNDGAHGILVNCMCDPGVKALRSILDIPVVGPAETAFHIAASLGHRFSVIDIGDDTAPMVEDQIHNYGLRSKFASIQGTGISVEDIHSSGKTFNALGKAAIKAVRQDRADVIVLGCTGFTGCAEAVKETLKNDGITGVPVIDPLPLAVRTLIGLVLEGHCHSKRAFPTPVKGEKRLHGYPEKDPMKKFYK